jgi:hypothetical protein
MNTLHIPVDAFLFGLQFPKRQVEIVMAPKDERVNLVSQR